MEKFQVTGKTPLIGDIALSGAKNVALKLCVAALLTDEKIILRNIPDIRDMRSMIEALTFIGLHCEFANHTLSLQCGNSIRTKIPLDLGAKLRASSLLLGPLLVRYGEAFIPNPGGCRIGARPINRHIDALMSMGASIIYNSEDGFFHGTAHGLHGAVVNFPKNTHTGTESVILSAVLAKGTTVIENAAEEVEIDDLISLLTAMGASIKRETPRKIIITGVSTLHGAEYTVMSDRNEEVTLAVAAYVTGGAITVHNSQAHNLGMFYENLTRIGANYDRLDPVTTRYTSGNPLKKCQIVTRPHPGFMTDWQAPWALLMTQATGKSTIHETVFESRFSYVPELVKMGAKIHFFDPVIPDPESFYNFNPSDHDAGMHQAISIEGPVTLHNAVLSMNDLRAGATLLLAAIMAKGTSVLYGVEQIDRGYEKIDERLVALGASIKRLHEEDV